MLKNRKNFKTSKILLDTHVWVWICENKNISNQFKELIAKHHSTDSLYLSPISFWELGMLVKKGRLQVTMDCFEWVKKASAGLRIVPISAQIAIHSSYLIGEMHKDPADRLLVATATLRKMAFATADEKLLLYGKEHSLPFIDPR